MKKSLRANAGRDGDPRESPRTMQRSFRRTINDSRLRLFGRGDPSRLIAFVCECDERDCYRALALTSEEYRRSRDEALLHPEHGRRVGPTA